MPSINDNVNKVHQQIQDAAHACGRSPNDVTLLAVSKKHSREAIIDAYHCGQRHFGENYPQEALEKIGSLGELDISWHFIGHLQSNKTRAIAEAFEWVHTVDRLKLAQRLDQQRPSAMPPLNICLQVNIDNEPQKGGVSLDACEALALSIIALPNLRLRGLMCIPAKNAERPFARLAALQETLKHKTSLAYLDTLSMGMSGDLDEAIVAGATIVRVGTAIFGARE